jgi:FkbM family methyltransferase
MNNAVKGALKSTFLYTVYRRFRQRRALAKMALRFREWNEVDTKRLKFYQQFIQPGDLVFDVGANMGNRTKAFLRLGARVVAFEPQQRCADFLDYVLGDQPDFKLLRLALGSHRGVGEMLVSEAHTLSSMSPDWISAIKGSGRFAQYEWNAKQVVSVETLDGVIGTFGRPTFLKVDVEGYESQVFAGLSTPVKFMSMEFAPEYLRNCNDSITHLNSLSKAEFQLSIGESMTFELSSWVSAEEIKQILSHVNPRLFGDVYVRMEQ